MIVDNFLDDYEWFRSYCDLIEYKDEVNEVDGVVYHGISTDIPVGIVADVILKLQRLVGGRITDYTMFLRLSVDGVNPPSPAHNDRSMGDYACILHLSRDDNSGTSFITHKEVGDIHEGNEHIMQRDTNDLDKWEVEENFKGVPNRALVFDSSIAHRAEPPYSYGSSAKDGRLVLVCFFSVA